MSEELSDELESQNQDVTDTETTDEVEETGAEPMTEDEDKPRYTESEMKMYARAKKAEAEAKRLKALLTNSKPEPKQTERKETVNQGPTLTEEQVDEKILRSQGLDDDAIEEAKYIAGRKGISLIAATHDERFIRFKTQAEEDKRKAEASLGASKGSGRKKSAPTFDQPLTREDHERLFNETVIK